MPRHDKGWTYPMKRGRDGTSAIVYYVVTMYFHETRIAPQTKGGRKHGRSIRLGAAVVGLAVLVSPTLGNAAATGDLATLPQAVRSRSAPGRPWRTNEAVTVDRIAGFASSADPELDEYGGWKGTHVGNPDGFFRVRKIGGRWWMVDPAGNLFLAKSVGSFTPGNSKRQQKALQEKFGIRVRWAADEMAFLKSCGFNSLGAWAADEAVDGSCPTQRMPYAVLISPMNAYNWSLKKSGRETDLFSRVRSGGSSFGFPFVFDEGFAEEAERRLSAAAKLADDPWLMGYFIDNELQFRLEMLDDCLSKWPEGHVNHDAAQRWIDARKGRPSCGVNDVSLEDRLEFVAYCLDVYLRTVTGILRRYDKNHLFLGCRFHLWNSELRNPAFFRVAGRYMDAVSINHYGRWQPDLDAMRNWEQWSGKPFMITEFYVKGEDSGLDNTSGAGWIVPTQEDRGIFYQNFVNGLVGSGACIGWHWFRYGDNDPEDTTRDPSNRDANKGIVTWDYRRYMPLVERMKEMNFCIYRLARFHENREHGIITAQ